MIHRLFRERWTSTTMVVVLGMAAILVGIAIAVDGSAAKAVNGVGGLLWVLSAVMTVRALWSSRPRWMWPLVIAVILGLVFFARPTDLMAASIGFMLGGALIALVARNDRSLWAMAIPALWLPVHLLVAVIRVLEREVRGLPANIRTDPPPTAAIVPFAMVVGAWIGANLAGAWLARARGNAVAETETA